MTGTEGPDIGVPLTRSQQLIWTGQSLAPQAPLYNMVWRIGFRGSLDPDRFAAAWASVVDRADILRARVVSGQGGPTQVIGPKTPPLEIVDLSAEADPAAAVDAWIAADGAVPVDLSGGTWRGRLFRLSDTDWVWYLNQHHIATDAGTGAVLMRRLGEAYSGAVNAAQPQFADYARGLADAPPPPAEVRRYWTTQAEGHRAMTHPYGASRRGDDPASRRIAVPFGSERSQTLRSLLDDRRFAAINRTLAEFALWAALYAGWLHRVTGDTQIRIGTPFHNRLTPEQQGTLGLFIEMFPLTVEVEPGDSLAALFQRCLVAAVEYIRHVRPGASTAETAASFNAVLNFMPVRIPGLPGLETDVRWLHTGAHDGAQDVRMHVYDFNDTGTYTVELDLAAGLIDSGGASAADHFLALADGAMADPETAIDSIALTDRRDAVLSGPSGQGAPASVLDTVTAHAASTAPAVICGDETLSHAELTSLSDRYAAALGDLGVGPGMAVAVWARRSLRLPAALLGVLKAGACFVPIPRDTPPDRARAILSVLAPSAIISDAETDIGAAMAGAPVLSLDATLPPARDNPGAGDRAYVIFTSGSTGTPKGVEIGHAAFARYIDWASRSYGPPGPKSYALCSGIGFDLTLTSIFVPLATGGTIRVYPETSGGTDLAVLDAMAEDVVDVVKLTPSHLALVTAQGQPVSRISTLILGGENLTTRACRKVRTVLGRHVVIANEYGPTEAVVGCMLHRFDPAADTGLSVPIGRPADDVTIEILDRGGNPVPVGVAGEIHIGGARLASGYFGDPPLTDAKFRSDGAGGRRYASGDLARVRADGVVEYLGRADRQLKLSGVRVEPAEIEAALLDHPDVSAAHAVLWAPAEAASRTCSRCGLSGTVPGVSFDAEDVCSICRDFETIRDYAQAYFNTPDALKAELAEARARRTGRYDAIMLLSGGKDSAYALYRLAELTRDVLVLTLDNGFISEGAKDNIRRMTADLGLEHRFLTTPAMNEIFRDSLQRFSNVCQGCFKTIYALALKVARDEGIPAIVTGLSRGQFFETRLTPDLFRKGPRSRAELDRIVHEARKSYHRMDDAVARHLSTGDYLTDDLLDEVRFIDIYRYLDVPVSEIYRFLAEKAPWVRPEDTGRSTNCLINDLGIHVHKSREGYHNYALPYSWDVRLGHKTREEAVAELDDDISPKRIDELGAAVGLDELRLAPRRGGVVAYVASTVSEADLRAYLMPRLPKDRMPRHIVVMDALPLTGNGKVDETALPRPDPVLSAPSAARVAPETETETVLWSVFSEVLGHAEFGVTDNFYDIGGESIAAVQISIAATDRGLRIGPTAVFEHQTIRALAEAVGTAAAPASPAAPAKRPNSPLIDIGAADLAALRRARARTGTT
ncbi:amino acid adenylation domain-containing protein [Rhodobacterales bacterium HKCCE3408]|nr:amino acid adenylation domain-containing protein [Rhodobacterales bacterium HKCCE3408]